MEIEKIELFKEDWFVVQYTDCSKLFRPYNLYCYLTKEGYTQEDIEGFGINKYYIRIMVIEELYRVFEDVN